MSVLTPSSVEEFVRRQLPPDAQPEGFSDAVSLFSATARRPEIVEGFPSFAPHLVAGGHSGYSQQEIANLASDQANGFYWPARNRVIAWLLDRYFRQAKRVLDIGCGTGYVTECAAATLPDAHFYATDTSIEGLKLAADRLGTRVFLTHLDAGQLPFRQVFDLVTTFDVLEHIEDDRQVIEQTREALRPGGGVVHFVPQHPWMYSPADRDSRHFRRYARRELQEKLEKGGFQVIDTTSFICGLFPLFVASRMKSMLVGEHSHVNEHRQAGWINAMLASAQSGEFALLKSGWRFPVGVSRAVVAFRR